MSDSLSTQQIKRRSLQGTKWFVLTNLFGMPSSYLLSILLARTGPAALGAYALSQIFLSIINTFATFGGPSVLHNFVPKTPEPELRGRLLFSYGLLSAGLAVVMLSVFYLFPGLAQFLMRREIDSGDFAWFALLSVVVVLSETLIGAVSGLLHLKLSSIARMMTRIVTLPVVVVVFITDRTFLGDYALEILLGCILVSSALNALLCIRKLRQDPRFRMRLRGYFPPGFVSFGLTSSAALFFSAFYANFDRLYVLGLGNIEGLGVYQAVISMMLVVEYVPSLLLLAIQPTLSSLLAANQIGTVRKAFAYITRHTVFLIAVTSLAMMGFSREILEILGKEYGRYDYLLVLFCFVSILRAPAYPALSILVILEKNLFRVAQSVLQITIQILGTVALAPAYGIPAIAGCKMVGGALSTVAATLYVVYGLKMSAGLPRSYLVSVAVGALMVVLRIFIVPPGWVYSVGLTALCLGLFLGLARFTVEEIRDLLRAFLTSDAKHLKGIEEKDFNSRDTR